MGWRLEGTANTKTHVVPAGHCTQTLLAMTGAKPGSHPWGGIAASAKGAPKSEAKARMASEQKKPGPPNRRLRRNDAIGLELMTLNKARSQHSGDNSSGDLKSRWENRKDEESCEKRSFFNWT